MQTQNQEKTKQKEVPKEVRSSQFGCPNCLWCGIECQKGSKYIQRTDTDKSCKSYTFYD